MEEPTKKKQRTTNSGMELQQRTKLIHTEVIRYEAESYTTLVDNDDSSARLPTYMEASPLSNLPRYPSPSADFTQATRLIETPKPYILYFPRIFIDTQEVAIGPDDDGQDEWRRLGPGIDGGWMAWPNGRWVEEGPGVFRWVR